MSNKIQAIDLRLPKEKRDLAEKIPLPVPYALYLETNNVCNARCAYCPTGHKDLRKMRPNGLMKWDVFTKIVTDIAEFGKKLRRISAYKDGEPLLHPKFPEMIRYMKDADISESIWTKTNGLLLTPELNDRLVSCGLDMIGVSVQHVNTEGYKRVADVNMDYDKFIANIADLYRKRTFKLYAKIADTGLTGSEKQKFFDDFGPIADYVAVEGLHGWSNSDVKDFKLGTNPASFEGYPSTDKIVCPLPFYLMAVNWNGTVSLCNEAWQHHPIIGDITTQTLKEIWEGEDLRQARIAHLEGRRAEFVSCRNCDYLRTLPDNLDGVRNELIQRLEQ